MNLNENRIIIALKKPLTFDNHFTSAISSPLKQVRNILKSTAKI